MSMMARQDQINRSAFKSISRIKMEKERTRLLFYVILQAIKQYTLVYEMCTIRNHTFCLQLGCSVGVAVLASAAYCFLCSASKQYLDKRRLVIQFTLKETLGRASTFDFIIPNQHFGIIIYILDNIPFLSRIPLQVDPLPLFLDFFVW